jgi:hypothetical protein
MLLIAYAPTTPPIVLVLDGTHRRLRALRSAAIVLAACVLLSGPAESSDPP